MLSALRTHYDPVDPTAVVDFEDVEEQTRTLLNPIVGTLVD